MVVKFSFIGVGNITRAILSAINSTEGKLKTDRSDIYLYDIIEDKTNEFKATGYNVVRSIDECVLNSDYIFLCVKPQNYRDVLEYIKNNDLDTTSKTFVSVAAGISTDAICECLGRECAVIRTMPNTPMMIGEGVCAICHNEHVAPKQFERICRLLSSKAQLLVLDESMMNKIIGITSSAPAYVYKFIDALYDASKAEGFDTPEMLEIICQVFIGSAKMVMNSNKDIKSLISAVKSPNGTTERALNVLESENISKIILDAVIECNKRAETLGEEM